MNEYVFNDLSIGLTGSLVVYLEQTHVDAFIALSGDASTVHMDDEYAKARGFQQRLVHGVLISAYMSQLIGMQLPGKHGILRTMACEFRKPCYVPERLTLTGQIKRLVPSLRIADLTIEVRGRSGDLFVSAKAETVLKM